MSWAPLLVIVISVANRKLALVLYLICPMFSFWAVRTTILFILSCLEWKKLKKLHKQ